MQQQSQTDQSQTELALFIKQVRENFESAGRQKSGGWLSRMIKKLFS